MGGNGTKLASGTIIGVQEMRFRLFTDEGKGLLLTLGHNSSISIDDLKNWHRTNARVVVIYDGEPNFKSAVVHTVRPA